jgi:hypothetical protein
LWFSLHRQAEQLRQQEAECSFKPRLDARSAAIAEARRKKGMAVHEALQLSKADYDAKCEARRRRKQQAEQEACTFEPKTNGRVKVAGGWVEPAARVTQPAPPKPPRMTTLDKEVEAFCTFKPATNAYPGSSHRIDCTLSPQPDSIRRSNSYSLAHSLSREHSFRTSQPPSEAAADSRQSSRAASVLGDAPPPPAAAELGVELQSESALLAEIGVDASAAPLNAQQLEAKFYADLAAELREVDF